MSDPSDNIRPGTWYEGDHPAESTFDGASGLPPGWSIAYNESGVPEQVLPVEDIGEHGRDAGAGPDARP